MIERKLHVQVDLLILHKMEGRLGIKIKTLTIKKSASETVLITINIHHLTSAD